MTTPKIIITHKEVASLLSISVTTLDRRAVEWKLSQFQSKASRRERLYFWPRLKRHLLEIGVLDEN